MPTSSTFPMAEEPLARIYPTFPRVSGESPPSKSFFSTCDTTWRCLYSDCDEPHGMAAGARSFMTVALVAKPDANNALLKMSLSGGTGALLTETGRTITITRPKIESMKMLGTADGFAPSADGTSVLLVRLSCAFSDLHAN